MLPNLFPTENDTELQEEFVVTGDMLSLKGQVWPGMGKMDLANEDMRRTRNQRKPNSVIEKMKRTSEGIEPTQVIMTPEFEIERIKGVYDETSSPSPSGDEQVGHMAMQCANHAANRFSVTAAKGSQAKTQENRHSTDRSICQYSSRWHWTSSRPCFVVRPKRQAQARP